MSAALTRRDLLKTTAGWAGTAAGAGLLGAPWQVAAAEAAGKKIVFLPGRGSHGWGAHVHRGGCLLLAQCLTASLPGVQTVVHPDGFPSDPAVLDGVAAVVIFCDGNGVIGPTANYQALDARAKKGLGIAFLHYSLDVGKENGKYLLDWIGGYYEQFWSINPTWTAKFTSLPDHPVARGVRPFTLHDEWYYHMRFRDRMQGVTPILSAVPPEHTREGPDGPHSGNPQVRARKGLPEHLAWAFQRPEGGRGFGFTGGHFHWNWAYDDFRKVVLNGIAWIAGIDVPAGGIPSKTPTPEDLEANQDSPRPKKWTRETTRRVIERQKNM